MTLQRYKPGVSKHWLLVLAGISWSAVGVVLCRMGYVWLRAVPIKLGVTIALCGLTGALLVHRFGFSKIAGKNIARVCRLPAKSCIFAFQAWRSYLIIVVMVALGISLRHSPIPKYLLAPVYITIGGALFLSSLGYYSGCWRVFRQGAGN